MKLRAIMPCSGGELHVYDHPQLGKLAVAVATSDGTEADLIDIRVLHTAVEERRRLVQEALLDALGQRAE